MRFSPMMTHIVILGLVMSFEMIFGPMMSRIGR